MEKKIYLGDGVYFDYDGYHVLLTTRDGLMETNGICLDPSVVVALVAAIEGLKKTIA